MSQINNIDGLTIDQINNELRKGGKFVYFPFVISIIIMTFRRSSDIYFVRADESGMKFGWPQFLITFFFGWWGIPFGPIYSIGAIYRFFAGGKDVTAEVLAHFNNQAEIQLEE